MATAAANQLLVLFLVFLLRGARVESLKYDYSATIECLDEPLKPQYGGGIVVNPEFDHGLRGWTPFRGAYPEKRTSNGGNNFMVVHSNDPSDLTPSQKLYLQKDMLYTFSAWVQIRGGAARVGGVFKTAGGGNVTAGVTVAQSGCWSMIKGGLSVNVSGPAHLYFQVIEESKKASVEIWVDSVSLQPFTPEQWRSHQEESSQEARKGNVWLHAADAEGKSLAGATISITPTALSFPLGCAINKNILSNPAYAQWFSARGFTVTSFENELKWYSTEATQGKEDYSTVDALFAFAGQHSLAVRGHNVFWDDPNYQNSWVPGLSADQLRAATDRRISSVMSRYAGRVNGWDVVNENLHFNFFESRLGPGFSTDAYQKAHGFDGKATMFLNEFNTIETGGDKKASPAELIRKVGEVKGQGATGIGLEGHFNQLDLAYMRSALDQLTATGLPVWVTELDVKAGPNQASDLETILRELHSHPGIQGIVIWAAWSPQGCYQMCLTDNNFSNLPTGDVVDKLLKEWGAANVVATTDSQGYLEASLFHGDYQLTITHPSTNSSFAHSIKVQASPPGEKTVYQLQATVSL